MSPQYLLSLSPRIAPGTARRIAAACGVGVLALGGVGCGSSDDGTPASTAPEGGTGQGPQNTRAGGGQLPGALGTIAAVEGSTAQVQSPGAGQVAVTWNGSTTFTKQVAGTLADVAVGTCVVVQSDAEDAAGDDAAPATEVTATTVRITAKGTDGTCAGGLGGPGGAGSRLSLSTDGGSRPPSGGGQLRRIGGAFGEVTAVTGNGFTVKQRLPDFGTSGSGSTPTTTESTVTVTVTGGTTYTKSGKATASDVKVGGCLRAQGTTDSTGAVTAKTVALSPATDGECGGGFRRSTQGAPTQGS